MAQCVYRARASIGRCNIIQASCTLSHDNTLGDFNYLAPGVVLGGRVSIANYCFLGLNCTVRSDVSLPDKTLLGCACNLLKTSELVWRGYIGNPARRLDKDSVELEI